MCKWGTDRKMWLKVSSDLSYNGKERWKFTGIDSCISSLVGKLQKSGVDMRSSCCGHGKGPGNILLQDGRKIIILSQKQVGG